MGNLSQKSIFIVEKIPEEMKNLNQWFVGNKEKKPFTPKTNDIGYPDKIETCGSFEDCYHSFKKNRHFFCVGFNFYDTDTYIAIDLDDCVKEGIVTEKAKEIIDYFDSYTEYSPSGKGIHIILKVTKQQVNINGSYKKIKNNIDFKEIEIIKTHKYCTLTGDLYEEKGEIKEGTEKLNSFIKEYAPEPEKEVKKNTTISKEEQIKSIIQEIFPQIRKWKDDGDSENICCPFHDEKNPSFAINYKKEGTYNCFGCGAKGNIYTLMDLKKYSGNIKLEKNNHPWYTEKGKFMPQILAEHIAEQHDFIYAQRFLDYQNGYWKEIHKDEIKHIITKYFIKNNAQMGHIEATLEFLRLKNLKSVDLFDKDGFINLKNCVLKINEIKVEKK